ncbi:MAG TPA: HAD hydrolase family protein [Burkholderiales bacterium]|nr:HAD hydrolase family protein [Burkholderiales bacterium]
MQHIYELARVVRLAAFDVDGIMTDGRLYYSERGEELKVFDVRDGHGLKMLQESGVELALITSRSSRAVALRAENLGIRRVYQGAGNKLETFHALLAELRLEPGAASFMGDDLVDLPVMRRCGLSCTVPEAPQEVRDVAHYVTRASGGRGAVREACELILRAQGNFDAQLRVHGS